MVSGGIKLMWFSCKEALINSEVVKLVIFKCFWQPYVPEPLKLGQSYRICLRQKYLARTRVCVDVLFMRILVGVL